MKKFEHLRFEQVFSLWKNARRGEALPRLNDVHVEKLEKFTSMISVLEKTADGMFLFRHIGQKIVIGVGTELTRVNMLDMVVSHEISDTVKSLDAVIEKPCGALSSYSADYSNGVETSVESLSLPVIVEQGGPVAILSMNVTFPDLKLRELGAGVIIGARHSVFNLFDLELTTTSSAYN